MNALMTYWNDVWTHAVRHDSHNTYSHSPAELAAFERRMQRLRSTAPTASAASR